MDPLHIRDPYVALDDVCEARPLPVTADFWSDLRTGRLGDFPGMVSFSSFEGGGSSWEKHPAGEEVVMLLAGRVELALESRPWGTLDFTVEDSDSHTLCFSEDA